jgi:hypothetical protein
MTILYAMNVCANWRKSRRNAVVSRSGINESQKAVHIPDDEWADNWEMAFKREKKNDEVMKHKRKPKDET